MYKKLTIRRVLCGTLILFLTVVGGLWFQNAKNRANEIQAKAWLFEIGHAVSWYDQEYGHLPPAVTFHGDVPMHSWRMLIMEFYDPDLFKAYNLNEPWNSPSNLKLQDRMPAMFQGIRASSTDAEQQFLTSCVVPIGPHTVFRDSRMPPRSLSTLVLGARGIPDRHDDKVMLVQMPGASIHWMSPVDASCNEILHSFEAAGASSYAHVTQTNGRTVLASKIPNPELKQRFEVRD